MTRVMNAMSFMDCEKMSRSRHASSSRFLPATQPIRQSGIGALVWSVIHSLNKCMFVRAFDIHLFYFRTTV